MKDSKKYIRYDEALTDNEILLYSQIIIKFEKGEIDFQTLKNIFMNYGVTVEPKIYDFSKDRMTIFEADIIKKRISEQKYLYSDVKYFILNSKEFKDVAFRIDYKAIELLANSGIPEYQENMISILKTQLRYSSGRDEKLAIERAKWGRRIAELELELELSKHHKLNNSK